MTSFGDNASRARTDRARGDRGRLGLRHAPPAPPMKELLLRLEYISPAREAIRGPVSLTAILTSLRPQLDESEKPFDVKPSKGSLKSDSTMTMPEGTSLKRDDDVAGCRVRPALQGSAPTSVRGQR